MVMEDMVDMVLDIAVDTMVVMVDTVLDMAVDTMASVRLRLSPRPRLRLIPITMEDMAMEDMADMVLDIAVDTMVDMVDTVLGMDVDTMAMDMAVNFLHQDWNLDSFCPKLSQNS